MPPQPDDADEPLSRRRFLGRAAAWSAGAALAPLLAACDTRRTVEDQGRRLVIAIPRGILSLDPAQAIMALDGFIICNIHETLTWHDLSAKLGPKLALSWEPAEDGRVWTFKLRPDVKFHDGTPFDSAAVKHHFTRLKDPATKSKRVTKVSRLASIETPDPMTVRFLMNEPYAMWPVTIRDAFASIVSPTAVRRAEDEERERASRESRSPELAIAYHGAPVGTGPYKFAKFEPERFVRLTRNPDHRDAAQHRFEEVEFRVVREPTTRVIFLEQGKLDVADLLFAHTDVAEKSGRVKVMKEPFLALRYVGLNNMKPPFDDIRVRRAVNMAVDREALVKHALRGNALAARGLIPPGVPGAANDLPWFDHDPEAARRLLREAGHAGGVDVTMWAIDDSLDTSLAVVMASQLAEVGVRVAIKRFDRATYWQQFDAYQTNTGGWFPTKAGVFDMFVAGWVGGEHPHGYLDPLFRSTSASNSAFYKNPEVDRLIGDSLKGTDETARLAVYRKLQETIVADAPWLFAYFPRTLWGVNPKLEGVRIHPAGEYELAGVRLGGVTGAV